MISDSTVEAATVVAKEYATGNPFVLWTEEDWRTMHAVTSVRKSPEIVTVRVQVVGRGYLKP